MDEQVEICHCCHAAQVPEKWALCGQCEAESYERSEE